MDINFLKIIRLLIIISLFIVIILLIRQKIAFKYEKRIGRYAIDSVNNDVVSIFDKLKEKYEKLIIKLRKLLSKSILVKTLSKKYEKYISYGEETSPIDFISKKIIIAILFIILVIVSKSLQSKLINGLDLIIYFILGYYIFDIYIIYNKKRKEKLIEEQLLRAIIIMNNAFKSGKSTLQAVQIAARELDEPLNHEFEKMYKDMKYGLAIDTVFERFAKRINVEDARYLSSSLIILNKTGGNIVKVFSAIEKTLFDKKKLKEELKNQTASSNLVVKILIFVPIIFVFIVYFLNKDYFKPFFESALGYILLVIIFIMFIIYVYVLRKITKVKV